MGGREERMTIRNEQRGAAERLLDLVLNGSAHLWHNRPGVDLNGTWHPATARFRRYGAPVVRPGLFVPAAVDLYRTLLDIYRLDAELAARFASYALTGTDWRDLQGRGAALMRVQPRGAPPVRRD